MNRILRIWVLLFIANLAARPAISYLGFYHVDVRYEAFVQLVVLPIVQTLVLAAFVGAITWRSLFSPLARLRQDPVLSLFVIVDGILLLISLMPGLPDWMRLTAPQGLGGFYGALKAIAAGALAVAACFRIEKASQRRWLMVFGVSLCAYGLDYFIGWLSPLSALFFPGWPVLFQWMFFYGPIFAIAMVLAGQVESIWAARCPDAGFILRYAAALASLATVVVALAYFNRSFIPYPWDTVVKILSFLSLTALVLAPLLAVRSAPACDKM